jgi:hypothetical protein
MDITTIASGYSPARWTYRKSDIAPTMFELCEITLTYFRQPLPLLVCPEFTASFPAHWGTDQSGPYLISIRNDCPWAGGWETKPKGAAGTFLTRDGQGAVVSFRDPRGYRQTQS